jgi:uncharacterized protein YlxW (UPF0749 family)
MAARSQDRGRAVPGRRRHARRSPAGLVGQFMVLLLAGFLFATSAQTANGTQLRSDRADAAGLLRAEQSRYDAQAKQVAVLQREVDALTAQAGVGDSAVAALQRRSQGLLVAAGMKPMRGPGLTVTLDDAPRIGNLPTGVRPDDLVVHQQDVQAVVNALWSGGAEAIELMDQRVISTSAVRCVGNTLILQGRVYSPPYRVTAIGNVAAMQRALDESPQINVYQEYVQALGLGWSVVPHNSVTIPAYTGSLELRYAEVPQQDEPGATGGTRSPFTTGVTGTGTTQP